MTTSATPTWHESLAGELDRLEGALLDNAAPDVESASQRIQALMRAIPADALQAPAQLRQTADRLSRLQQAVIRSAARSRRAVQTLFPRMPDGYGKAATKGQAYHLSA